MGNDDTVNLALVGCFGTEIGIKYTKGLSIGL